MRRRGWRRWPDARGASLNLSADSRNVHVAEGALCRDFDVIDPVADADFVVNCCKLKTHCMTTLSCGVKNLFGCVPGLLKPQLHYRFPDGEQFARMLVDLSLLVKPGLTVADAVDAMEGDGPTGRQAAACGTDRRREIRRPLRARSRIGGADRARPRPGAHARGSGAGAASARTASPAWNCSGTRCRR